MERNSFKEYSDSRYGVKRRAVTDKSLLQFFSPRSRHCLTHRRPKLTIRRVRYCGFFLLLSERSAKRDIGHILYYRTTQVAQARYMSSSMLTFALLRDSSDLHIYKDLYGERNKPEKKRKITVELQ